MHCVTYVSKTEEGVQSWPLHSHSGCEVMVYLSGRGVLQTTCGSIPFQPGRICIIPPGLLHGSQGEALSTTEKASCFQNICLYTQDDSLFQRLQLSKSRASSGSHPLAVWDTANGDVRTLAQMIYRLYLEDEVQNRWSNATLLDAVAGLILSQLCSSSPDLGTRCVEQLRRQMLTGFVKQDFSLSQAIAASGYSADHLRVLFKKVYGFTPRQYLQRLRIDYGEHLLQTYQDNLTLAEIARLCGFSDEYYFSRKFRQLKGHTPRGKE